MCGGGGGRLGDFARSPLLISFKGDDCTSLTPVCDAAWATFFLLRTADVASSVAYGVIPNWATRRSTMLKYQGRYGGSPEQDKVHNCLHFVGKTDENISCDEMFLQKSYLRQEKVTKK